MVPGSTCEPMRCSMSAFMALAAGKSAKAAWSPDILCVLPAGDMIFMYSSR